MFCEGFSVFFMGTCFHNGSLKTFCMIRNMGRTDLAKIPNISKIQPNAGILLNGVAYIGSFSVVRGKQTEVFHLFLEHLVLFMKNSGFLRFPLNYLSGKF